MWAQLTYLHNQISRKQKTVC